MKKLILTNGLTLRPMQREDVPVMMCIEEQAYPYPWTEGIFRDCLRAGYPCWVLWQGPTLLGYSVISVAVEECHLLNLCIAPSHQGQGYGRQLLRVILDLGKSLMAKTAYLEVRPSNTAALRLYLSEGFNEIAVRKRYYPSSQGREDALILAKTLVF